MVNLFEYSPRGFGYFYKVRGMESRDALESKLLWLAVIISLLLHTAVLLISVSSPGPTAGSAANPDHSNKAAGPSPRHHCQALVDGSAKPTALGFVNGGF